MWIPSLFRLLHFKMCVSVYSSHHLGLLSYLNSVNDDGSVISIVFGHKSNWPYDGSDGKSDGHLGYYMHPEGDMNMHTPNYVAVHLRAVDTFYSWP